METPLGSGAAPNFFFFFCISLHNPTPNRAACRGLARANCVCGWMDGCMCMFLWLRASGREKATEIKTRWEGLRERTKGGGGMNDRERNEWWRQWVGNTNRYTRAGRRLQRAHILQQRWLEYVRVSEQGECVGGGMPQQCSLFRLRFDPCSPDLRGSSLHLLQANSRSVMPNLASPSLLSHTRVHNDPNDF